MIILTIMYWFFCENHTFAQVMHFSLQYNNTSQPGRDLNLPMLMHSHLYPQNILITHSTSNPPVNHIRHSYLYNSAVNVTMMNLYRASIT